jgi:hypothetical protein
MLLAEEERVFRTLESGGGMQCSANENEDAGKARHDERKRERGGREEERKSRKGVRTKMKRVGGTRVTVIC